MLALALAASSAYAAPDSGVVRDGLRYGNVEQLSGVYLTNFERSTFVRCNRKTGGCRDWTGSTEDYAVECDPTACAALEARIKAINGSHDKWALFAIDFTGRRSIGPGRSRWLGDPARKVFVEHLERLTLRETR